MSGVQRVQSTVPPPRHVSKPRTQESQLVEVNEVPPVKRLNGEVTRQQELTSAGGTNCDVWLGRWKKCRRGWGGREEVYEEKVCSSLITSTLLTWIFIGRVESSSSAEGIGGGTQGLTFADRLHGFSNSCLLPRLLETRA